MYLLGKMVVPQMLAQASRGISLLMELLLIYQ
uniref:Uncharacterized protein n=1 Tax=CrAss-like virus sp. ctRQZ5 TaxID=2826824 RepID=A0A8S5LXY8_9CAUD|nr:MAG TPA: hypothetical protein [CrAss-like virus sp. ctRQZ5]